MTLSIAVFSDVVCPWCLLGKRRLERALDTLGIRDTTTVEWLPFELNPDMPADGMERAAYRAAKFGSERSATLDREMIERGRLEGVSFAFDRLARTPNTRKAHRLVAHASKQGHGEAVVESLFRAYFEEARDVGSDAVLLAIAAEHGVQGAAEALVDEKLGREVVALERRGAELGIEGVPFFIVDHQWALSGAQPPEQWVEVLRERVPGLAVAAE